jgi:Glycosyl transferase family group 2
MHLACPDSASTTLYTAPIIFDRNAHQVPGIVCVADVLWCAVGLSGLYPGSTISPPTSVYSVPLGMADQVGGWDTGREAIGEDLHMYLKCFFALNGHLISRTVRSPASQTNITGPESVGLVGYVGGVSARYRQALRHMWGSLDSGYALKKCVELWRRRRRFLCLYRPLHAIPNEIADELLSRMENDGFLGYQMERGHTQVVRVPRLPPHWLNILLLFHRLFEAHFLPTHITVLIVISTLYRALTPADSGPFSIAWTFVATDILRAVEMVALLIYFYSYQEYHRIALESRRSEMVAAGLADGMRGSFSDKSWKNVLGCVWIPLVAPLYDSIPAFHAQLPHFWTIDLVYVVSNKTVRGKIQA